MHKFFNPQSIAIIGASEDRKKVGGMILENILENGFTGEVFPVNPKGGIIQGKKAYDRIIEIEKDVDLALIVVPAEKVLEVVRECGERTTPILNLIIISAGFSEAGEAGRVIAKKLSLLVKKYNLKIAGPNCLGIINPWKNLNASFSGVSAEKGKIGLIMQSGAFVSAFLDWGKDLDLGFSAIATIGNKTFLDETDFLDYFIQDKKTEMIGLYLESILDGKKLCQKIRTISSRKPVLILKAEGGEKTQKAALSHTAAMAGEDLIARKALEEAGALVFSEPQKFWLVLRYFSQFKIPKNRKILFLTNAGGPGVTALGLAEKSSWLEILEMKEKQKELLRKKLPPASSVGNPVDLLGDADEKRYADVLEIIENFSNIGSVVVLLTKQKQTEKEAILKQICLAQEKSDFPIIPVFMTSGKKQKAVFNFFEEALIGLEAGLRFRKIKERVKENVRWKKDLKRQTVAKEIFLSAQKEKRTGLYYSESFKLAKLYEINLAENFLEKENRLSLRKKFPMVLKIDDPQIFHKEIKRGVIMDLKNEEEFKKAKAELEQNFPQSRLVAQFQETGGLEIILGIKKDPAFGPVVLCGLGGILTEFLGEKLFFFSEMNEVERQEILIKSFLGKILARKRIDSFKLLKEIEKLLLMANENSWIKELDINPLLLYSDKDFLAVDFKASF